MSWKYQQWFWQYRKWWISLMWDITGLHFGLQFTIQPKHLWLSLDLLVFDLVIQRIPPESPSTTAEVQE